MALPRVADGGGDLQVWKAVANEQRCSAGKGQSFSLWFVRKVTSSSQ
jgi:hypothetical protein